MANKNKKTDRQNSLADNPIQNKTKQIYAEIEYEEAQIALYEAKARKQKLEDYYDTISGFTSSAVNYHRRINTKPQVLNNQDYIASLTTHELASEVRRISKLSPIPQAIANQAGSYLVAGRGITVNPLPLLNNGKVDHKLANKLKKLWGDFCKAPLIDRPNVDFVNLLYLLVDSYYKDGEVWVAYLIDERGSSPSFKLKVYPSSYVSLANDGIEVDKYGCPLFYKFSNGAGQAVKLPAEQVFQIANFISPTDVRGSSVIGPAVQLIKDYHQYLSNEITKSTINASIIATVTEDLKDDDFYTTQTPPSEFELNSNTKFINVPKGKKVSFMSPNTTNANAGEFSAILLRMIASATGVKYSELANVNESSYSASRAEDVNAIQRYREHAANLKCSFMVPLYEAFVRFQISAGELKNVKQGNYQDIANATYTHPPRPTVDPLKDVNATKEQLRLGMIPMTDVLSSSGNTPDDIISTIAQVRDKFEKEGLLDIFDIMMGRTGEKGYSPEAQQSDEEDKSEVTQTSKQPKGD